METGKFQAETKEEEEERRKNENETPKLNYQHSLLLAFINIKTPD